MKITCIGGGPAGLYLGILMKKANRGHEIIVIERNRPDDTFGFGVVFSDATLGNLAAADPESFTAIADSFAHWDDIDTHIRGRVVRSTGHGFCGLERKTLLAILQRRARELGITMRFETEIADLASPELAGSDLVVIADGVASLLRDRNADFFEPDIDVRPNRFVWLGTTFPFQAFTFYFKEHEHGLFRVHAYRYHEHGSTFIVECTEDTWRRAGLDSASEDETIAYLETVFAGELAGHRLIKNRSIWRSFPTVRNKRWHHQNIVLVGDAAHTAHFSIGSGTKLAMEDCISLAEALGDALDGEGKAGRPAELDPGALDAALADYERRRRPEVDALQRAAQHSLEWFENTERYMDLPAEQFTFSLLTRSLRVGHESLRKRDPDLVAAVDRVFAGRAREQCEEDTSGMPRTARAGQGRAATGSDTTVVPPPMFTPFRLRERVLQNRIVAASPDQGRAEDGVVGDWHFLHWGNLAVGGAGLIMTEPLAVTAVGRAGPGSAGLYSDACRHALGRAIDFIHRNTTSLVGALLGHAGPRSMASGDAAGGLAAPSAGGPQPRSLLRAGMDRIVGDFAGAAERARSAGCDLVCIDMAGGHLLAGFLSPLVNQRDDEYGASLDGRVRFPLEVVAAVRLAWPAELPLAVKLAARDSQPGGLTADESVKIAALLEEAGCDIVWVTAGGNQPGDDAPASRLAHTPLADLIRNEADNPVMASGGITSHADINSILAAGRADLCVVSRAVLFDPFFVRRAAARQGHDLEWPEPLAAVRGFVPHE